MWRVRQHGEQVLPGLLTSGSVLLSRQSKVIALDPQINISSATLTAGSTLHVSTVVLVKTTKKNSETIWNYGRLS